MFHSVGKAGDHTQTYTAKKLKYIHLRFAEKNKHGKAPTYTRIRHEQRGGRKHEFKRH